MDVRQMPTLGRTSASVKMCSLYNYNVDPNGTAAVPTSSAPNPEFWELNTRMGKYSF